MHLLNNFVFILMYNNNQLFITYTKKCEGCVYLVKYVLPERQRRKETQRRVLIMFT